MKYAHQTRVWSLRMETCVFGGSTARGKYSFMK